ncbi:MAG: GNAT family N-acetyltransferase [Planctomycetota bacterium]
MKIQHGDYELVDGIEHVKFDEVQPWLAATYWSPGITIPTIIKGAENSALVISAFTKDGKQASFGRVVSDTTRFAYLTDIIVGDEHRGKGLGQAMVQFALDHPKFSSVTNWCLMTLDAHGVYEKLGFKPITDPESKTDRWMAKFRDRIW